MTFFQNQNQNQLNIYNLNFQALFQIQNSNQRTKKIIIKESHHSNKKKQIHQLKKFLQKTFLNLIRLLMKTIVYSQKHLNDHSHANSYTPNPYQQCNSTLPRKSATMKKFEYCINANTTQNIKIPKETHYHFLNQHNNSTGSSNTTTIMKPKKPTQKPIQNVQKNIICYFVKEYQKIISNLTQYYKYYEWILMKQVQKHDSYFTELIKIIQNEKRRSQNFLQQQIQSLAQKIQLQKAALQNKISQLQNSNIKPFEKEKNQLESQRFLQIPLFQINLQKLDRFKSQVRKFLFQVTGPQQIGNQTYDVEVSADTIQLQSSMKTQKKQRVQHQDIASQYDIGDLTPIHSQNQQPPMSPKAMLPLEDKDLYCDEDINYILKNNNIVRKKRYDCGSDAIPQESQSHQDSLVLSNIDTII